VDLARTWESDRFAAKRLPVLPYVTENFRSFHELWLSQGYEGSVLKSKDSLAITSRIDGKTDSWTRCKALTSEDYVFMGIGWTPGGKTSPPKMTGKWGLYANGKLQFAMQAGVPEEYLREENIGILVVEFKGQYVMDSGALRHARFYRIRTDKDPRTCVMKS
jgi:ATP-dependent DNA ligase